MNIHLLCIKIYCARVRVASAGLGLESPVSEGGPGECGSRYLRLRESHQPFQNALKPGQDTLTPSQDTLGFVTWPAV